jgi:acyl-coenzyme A thioesterase PaaI-like protein
MSRRPSLSEFKPDALWSYLEKWFGLRRIINLFAPYLGAGITVESVSPDYSEITVKLKMHFYNRNYVGTHFGGSLYSMTDPWYMFMLMKRLGTGYIVWDKSASIEFIKPGTGTVRATFRLPEEVVEQIRSKLETGKKTDWSFEEVIVDEKGTIVARVRKVLYIRRIDR